jgi:hypothetical protein
MAFGSSTFFSIVGLDDRTTLCAPKFVESGDDGLKVHEERRMGSVGAKSADWWGVV